VGGLLLLALLKLLLLEAKHHTNDDRWLERLSELLKVAELEKVLLPNNFN
jgi:hypothetical protein